MKKVSSFCKIFFACIFFVYIFSCCETSGQGIHSINGCGEIKHNKPTRYIRITSADVSTRKLTLFDEFDCPADTLNIEAGQDVEWKIDGSSIQSIDNIVIKSEGSTVFEKPPHKKFWSKHWKGNTKKSNIIESVEYDIDWTATDKKHYTYDPLIQLNPNFNLAPKK